MEPEDTPVPPETPVEPKLDLSFLLSPPKLSIQMVPKPLWGKNLRKVVTKEEWGRLCQAAVEFYKHQCCYCKASLYKKSFHLHEEWLYDDCNLVQIFYAYRTVCRECHMAVHLGHSMSIGTGAFALAHLAEVNGWNLEQTEIYATYCLMEWRIRSMEVNWAQDFSLAVRNNIWFEAGMKGSPAEEILKETELPRDHIASLHVPPY